METLKGLDYWAGRWENNDAPWHKDTVNRFLVDHFDRATSHKEKPCRVLLPLCGKTPDLKWVYDQGHSVVGIDGVEPIVLDFFREHNLPFVKECIGDITGYTTEDGRLKIYVGDFFGMDPALIGKFDTIWDRGSLVAIYPEDRLRYAALLKQFYADKCAHLINTLEYDQTLYPGPPRSVSIAEIETLFGDTCMVEEVQRVDLNADPTTPHSAKMRWNVDVAHEIIALLTTKS